MDKKYTNDKEKICEKDDIQMIDFMADELEALHALEANIEYKPCIIEVAPCPFFFFILLA